MEYVLVKLPPLSGTICDVCGYPLRKIITSAFVYDRNAGVPVTNTETVLFRATLVVYPGYVPFTVAAANDPSDDAVRLPWLMGFQTADGDVPGTE
jgi:hypothetical protein